MLQPDASRSSEITPWERFYGAVTPYAFGAAWVAARMMGSSAHEMEARTGAVKSPTGRGPLLWFHGASAGEMSAALRLAGILRSEGYRFAAAYTASNRAGVEFCRSRLEASDVAGLAPWDVGRWIARAFDQWHPRAIFLVETEIWPGLILKASQRGVPIFAVSSRIYPKDLPRYRVIKGLIGQTFKRLTAILAQNERERENLISVGASQDRCIAAGNLKYAYLDQEGVRAPGTGGEIDFGLEAKDRAIVFGSVHADELDLIFSALDLLNDRGEVRVIVAPRHLEASDQIVRRAEQRAWQVAKRSHQIAGKPWRMLVLDTMGELGEAYRRGTIAVVGGGFRNHGGHNPYEPLNSGTPVVFGPWFKHFEQEAQSLEQAVPQARVRDAGELGRVLNEWLRDERQRTSALRMQEEVVPNGTLISAAYLKLLAPWLKEICA
jgi:3-deoxy-D-manno-octulosonic-acid transferase